MLISQHDVYEGLRKREATKKKARRLQHKPNSVDDKINLQTSACDKIANTELILSLTSQFDVIVITKSVF